MKHLDADDNSLSGFSKLPREERFRRLVELGALTPEDVRFFNQGGLRTPDLAEKLIENTLGYLQIPLGVATNFRIDGIDYVIPMAVEETSIIASASKTAKWVKQSGRIDTLLIGECIIGQIQIAKPQKAREYFEQSLNANKRSWIEAVNKVVANGLVQRGGGVRDIELRFVPRDKLNEFMVIFHVLLDARDAMGANIVNQVCEFLRAPIEQETGEKVAMCILSNLADTRLTRATVTLENVDRDLGRAIQEAALFAKQDPYRAATHNKGVLNGIDPILVATGNDWRAVESSVHAHAARDGAYRSITTWKYDEASKVLIGILEAPIVVGIVGGVTKLHPTAQLCLRMMKIESAAHLSRLCAAVGLVQNLGALTALTTVGIIEGHMRLHIKNLSLGAGASEQEIPIIQKRLERVLTRTKRVSLQNAIEALKDLRAEARA